jgi:signal transduction histidine kinase
MLISQYAKSSKVRDSKESATSSIHTLMSNILTTNKPTISGMADLFEELWNESLLREQERNARQMEEKARLEQERVSKEARLLQDILTHDIRNYNQVIKFSAELLREELSDNKNVDMLTDSLLKSVDGSIQLLDNAKKLGTLLSDQNPELFPVNLMETLESSLSLVKSANPDRVIEETRQISLAGYEIIPHNEVQVLADDFLLDVFTNILTNAVKYTIGRVVRIETVIEEAREDRVNAPDEEEPNSFLKISIGDYGVGIPNDRKEKIFGRYLEGAKGIGLGMSIVHALIVDRYHGKIRIGDRVEGDYTKGTVVKIWIPKVVNSAVA